MFAWLLSTCFAGGPPPGGWPVAPDQATVKSVYDGDTVTLDTGDKVRVKWVNTPEMKPLEPFAPEAKRLATDLVQGQTVKLLKEGANPRDSYGRIVAGLQTSSANLSEELLRQGLAHLFLIPPDGGDMTSLIAAQEEAKTARRGIWTNEQFQGELYFTSFHANAPGDDNVNINGEYLRVCNLTSKVLDIGGYRVEDRSGNRWTLPHVMIPPGHTFKLHSGEGQHQTNPSKQIEVYLQNKSPIWNNDRDTASIYRPDGALVTRREHERKSRY